MAPEVAQRSTLPPAPLAERISDRKRQTGYRKDLDILATSYRKRQTGYRKDTDILALATDVSEQREQSSAEPRRSAREITRAWLRRRTSHVSEPNMPSDFLLQFVPLEKVLGAAPVGTRGLKAKLRKRVSTQSS